MDLVLFSLWREEAWRLHDKKHEPTLGRLILTCNAQNAISVDLCAVALLLQHPLWRGKRRKLGRRGEKPPLREDCENGGEILPRQRIVRVKQTCSSECLKTSVGDQPHSGGTFGRCDVISVAEQLVGALVLKAESMQHTVHDMHRQFLVEPRFA